MTLKASYIAGSPNGYTPADVMQRDSDVITPGVISTSDLVVTQAAAPNMSVLVSGAAQGSVGGNAWLPSGYRVYNDASASLAIAASNATYPRIDLVIAAIDTSQPIYAPTLTVITGTPAASPVVPSVPSNYIYISLYQVNVAAGVSSILNANLVDVRSISGISTNGSTYINGKLMLGGNNSGTIGVELGSTIAATTPFIDFHSVAGNSDYDSRIIATGGTAGTPGKGTLQLIASILLSLNNTLDDGSGNATIGGDINLKPAGTSAGAWSHSLWLHALNASSQDIKAVAVQLDQLGGLHLNSYVISGISNAVSTRFNTLDDGSGNMTISGSMVSANVARYQAFSSSGTFTVPAGVYRIHVEMWGAGGGGAGGGGSGSYYHTKCSPYYIGAGGGGGGGGQAGTVACEWIPVTPGQQISVVIGAGGSAGAAGTVLNAGGAGGKGGNTSFGSMYALGGNGGSPGAGGISGMSGAGGAGGAGGSGSQGVGYSIVYWLGYNGGAGGTGSGAGQQSIASTGGSGGGGAPAGNTLANGAAGSGGSGGSGGGCLVYPGGGQNGAAGSVGQNGYCIVYW